MRSTSSCEEALEVEEHHHENEEDDSEAQPISPTNKGVFSSITCAVQNTVSAHLHLSISLSFLFWTSGILYPLLCILYSVSPFCLFMNLSLTVI